MAGEYQLDEEVKKCLLAYTQVSDRSRVVNVKDKSFNIFCFVLCTPPAQSMEENIESFKWKLDNVKAQCKSQEITIA